MNPECSSDLGHKISARFFCTGEQHAGGGCFCICFVFCAPRSGEQGEGAMHVSGRPSKGQEHRNVSRAAEGEILFWMP